MPKPPFRAMQKDEEYSNFIIEDYFTHTGLPFISPDHLARVLDKGENILFQSSRQRERYKTADPLFLPLLYHKHWYLFWVEGNTLYCLDGKNGQCIPRETLTNLLRSIVRLLNSCGKAIKPCEQRFIVEQALDSPQCGLVICCWAKHLFQKCSFLEIEQKIKANDGYEFFQADVDAALDAVARKKREAEGDSHDGDIEIIDPPRTLLPSGSLKKTCSSESEQGKTSDDRNPQKRIKLA